MMKESTVTNKEQMRILIDEMKANGEIARGTSVKTSAETLAFWCGLKLKLNKAGPPMRLLSGWKKVWSDYKSDLNKKITDISGSKAVPLSNLEAETLELLGVEKRLGRIVAAELNDCALVLPTDDLEAESAIAAGDSSSEDVYSLDNSDKLKDGETELAAKAIKLYDLQIAMLKKELNSWRSIDKENSDVATISNLNTTIPGTAADMKIEVDNVEVPCSSGNISTKQNQLNDAKREKLTTILLPKRRKLNTDADVSDNNCDGRIKTEIIDEQEIDMECNGTTKCATNNGIFIIDPPNPAHTNDTALSPLPPLTPAAPTVTNSTVYMPAALPPALQPAPNLNKRKFDATTNLHETHSSAQESTLINISNALQEIQETSKNFTFYLQKLFQAEEKKISLMQDANIEQKRHNQQMEKLARISF